MKKSFSLLLLSFSPFLYAEDDSVTLSPLTVTATRTEQQTKLASTTVISREDIERLQVNSIEEALRSIAGVNITNQGGRGKQTSVFLRGTNSSHVLVLIDGVRAGSVTAGITAFEHLPIEQIDSIEVVRGAKSSLYGSEAIGGVIHIHTRKSANKILQPTLSASIGSHDHYRYSGSLSGQWEDTWYSLSLSREQTHGFDACQNEAGIGFFACFANEADNDGYHNNSGSARLGHRFNDRLWVEAFALYTEGDTEFDGGFQNETDFVQQVVGGNIKFDATDFWTLSLKTGESRDKTRNKKDGLYTGHINSQRFNLSLQNDFEVFEDNILSIGYEFFNDTVDASNAFTETERDNHAVFLQYQGEYENHHLLLGFRHDEDSQFGDHRTWNVAWGYTFLDDFTVSASYATAFKAPTFNDLYFPFFGNPNLRPERSRSYEIGMSGVHDWGQWSVNHYYTYISNLIAFDNALFIPQNIEKARIRGVEVMGQTQLAGFDIRANFNYLNPENRTTGDLLLSRAETTFRLDIDKRFGDLSLGATIINEGRRFSSGFPNAYRLGGFTTLDLRAEYTLFEQLKLQAKFNNVLDKQYQTVKGYNTDNFNMFFTLSYTPEIDL